MFFAQNEYGSERLRQAFETLPIPSAQRLKTTARYLDVSERTLSNWISGKSNPPRAVVYAIWHESPIGRAVTSEHSAHGEMLWRKLASSQTERIKRLEAKIDTLREELRAAKLASIAPVAMNESFFNTY